MLEQFYKRRKRGVSIIEIVLALALFSIMTMALFSVQWSVGDLSENNAKDIVFQNTALSQIFNRGGIMRPFSFCLNKLEMAFSRMTFFYIEPDLDSGLKFGKDCGGYPDISFDSSLRVIHTIELGYLAGSVDLFKDTAYVGLRSMIESDPDMAQISLDDYTVSFLSADSAINRIDVVGNFLFAAHNSSTTQVSSLMTNSRFEPGGFATSSLPGVAGVRPEGVSIFYSDSKIFVGTKRTAGHEFHIFDVSNPLHPTWLGSREINHNINDIFVKDNLAFLATSGNLRDLIVLDICDPTNIRQVAEIDLVGNEDGKSVFVAGNYIFLGRYKSTVSIRDELNFIEYELDANGNFIDARLVDSIFTRSDINAISYFDQFVIVGTSSALGELQVFRIVNRKKFEEMFTLDLPDSITDLDYQNDILAVTAGSKLLILKNE